MFKNFNKILKYYLFLMVIIKNDVNYGCKKQTCLNLKKILKDCVLICNLPELTKIVINF